MLHLRIPPGIRRYLAAHVRPATPLQVSRPKAVMAIQLTALLLKIPLSALFIYVWNLPLPLGMGP